MKKALVLLLALTIALSALAGCAQKETTAKPGTEQAQPSETSAEATNLDDLMALFNKIEPLSEPVTLNISTTAGVYHNFFSYIAQKLGALEQVGVKANMVEFANGPLQVEAMGAGAIDCGGYGVGGILSGSVNMKTVIADYRLDEAIVQKFYVKADSAIAKSGLNEYGFYGTREDWENAEVYLPSGTTLQFLFGNAMAKLGLNTDDMNIVYTDADNIFTILKSGQGDAWGLWNMTAYESSLQNDYVEVMNGVTAGINLMSITAISRLAMKDAQKMEAIKRWYACQEAVVMWLNASEENLNTAIDWMYDWCQEEGVTGSYDSISIYLHDVKPISLEENKALFTENDENGMLKAKSINEKAMDYFVGNGSYTEADYEKLYDDSNYTTELIDYAISVLG